MAEKALFLGGSLKVTGILERPIWVAGQVCWLRIRIENNTNKRLKNLVLSLTRQLTVFKAAPELNIDSGARPTSGPVDRDACRASTNRRKIAETVLEVGQRGSRGQISAKGWWLGVDPNERASLRHGIMIPVSGM